MRFEVSMLTGLISVGTALLVRVQLQGFEAGLISAAAEFGLHGIRSLAKRFRAAA